MVAPVSKRKAKNNHAEKVNAVSLLSSKDEEDAMKRDLTKYVPTKQAATMLGVNRFWIVRLLAREKLRGIKLGHDWLVFIPSINSYRETKSKRGRPTSRVSQLQQ